MSNLIEKCEKETLVHQLVKVQADVNVKPHVKHGRCKIYCLDTDIKPHCECEKGEKDFYPSQGKPMKSEDECCFTLTQVFCIEVPITFDVDVDVDQGIECCKPDLGPCKRKCNDCGID